MRQGTTSRMVMGMFTFAALVLGYDLLYREFSKIKAIGFVLLCLALLLLGISNLIEIMKKLKE